MSDVRVRFAPSPTGFLHVGGARTALFNYLFAQHHEGAFILRIEDTDLERSTEAAIGAILNSLRWLGLEWDEGPEVGGSMGPYFQTERLELYEEFAERLVEQERAYYCYCTPEELKQRRQKQRERGEVPRYDRRCLDLTQSERKQFEEEGRARALRFRAPTQETVTVTDVVHGQIEFDPREAVDDFVIIKSDGTPTYNYAVVVDDHLMNITHVIRGDDHLSNTPKQVALYEALELECPVFAHLPMVLGPDKKRLSKRHGPTSVQEYRDKGYLPEAMTNYLSLLGWSLDDETEVFDMETAAGVFELEQVNKNPAVFDEEKLKWMNGLYIRELEVDEFYEKGLPFLVEAELVTADPPAEEEQRIKRILAAVQDRVKLLSELPFHTEYFFVEPEEYNEKGVNKHLSKPGRSELIRQARNSLAELETWDRESIEATVRGLMDELDVSGGDMIHPLRIATTGRTFSPGAFLTLELIGQEAVVRRLDRAVKFIEEELDG